ncbi:MAG: dTDP-4-dehydrorhamnose 3,5-epimerase family protein [Deltaproteobacteria bacterium]|nr:dTDP-4-dehydrorhamnose 3,5-epimerase family protein [Deltaproteobacteria bacterium]
MKFTELGLSGVWLIEPEPFSDERGTFFRNFCAQEFTEHGLTATMVQGNVSINPHLGTLRGFHYQKPPFGEAKTFSCMTGAIYDIVVDLRPQSPTFMKWIAVELSAQNRKSLHIPNGCANAWMTTSPNTIVHYYMSELYTAQAYRGFRYNDPTFAFQWPMEPVVISEKDRNLPDLDPNSIGRV